MTAIGIITHHPATAYRPTRRQPLWPKLRYVLAAILALVYLTPLVLTAISSLKSPAELQHVLAPPSGLYLRNYAVAWDRVGRSVLNSVMITAPAVVLSVLVGAVAAYPLAQIRIPGGRYIYLALLAGMLVPNQSVQIPLFVIMRWLGLYNTIPGMWLVHVAYGIPFCTFFMRNFFATVPKSMFEAAQLDGCGPATYFFRILLPASISGLAALALVQTRGIWNDLFFALTITSSPETSPVPVALYSLIGGMEVDEGPIMAATIISIVPMMLTFLLFQGAFRRGLLGGGSK